MIVTLRETTETNAEQGWLDSNLARIGGLLQGQRDLGEVCRMIMNEVDPAGRRPGRRVLPGRTGADGGAASCGCEASYGLRRRPSDGRSVVPRPARAWSARPPLTRRRDPGQRRAARLPADPVRARPRRRRPTWSCCRCCSRASRSASSSSPRVTRVLRAAPGLPGPARRHHRRRAQHDPRQPAHRGAARRSPSAWPRSCRSSRPSCSAPTPSWRRRRRCCPSRTATSRSRTARSSWPGSAWRRRRSSSRWPRSTSRSSWPT